MLLVTTISNWQRSVVKLHDSWLIFILYNIQQIWSDQQQVSSNALDVRYMQGVTKYLMNRNQSEAGDIFFGHPVDK